MEEGLTIPSTYPNPSGSYQSLTLGSYGNGTRTVVFCHVSGNIVHPVTAKSHD